MANMKCDTSSAGLLRPRVEEMVTMLGPCGRAGPSSGADHWAIHLRGVCVSLLPQQAEHQVLVGSLKLPVGLLHGDWGGGGGARWLC